MPTKYLVLRADAAIDRGFESTAPSAWRGPTGPSTLSLQTYDGKETDAGKLRADPQNACVMDADIVLSLIKPTATSIQGIAALKQVGALQMPSGLLAVGAHTTPFTGQGVTVAVLDTGIDGAHPAFAGKVLATRDFTGEGSPPDPAKDLHGHGTHCAATVCGAPVAGVRVGVAPGVTKLCAGKVLGSKGGTLEMLLSGMFWAVMDEKASVVSMSLGYDLPGNTARLIAKGVNPAQAAQLVLRQHNDLIKGIATLKAFLEAVSSNLILVAASGNESQRPGFVLDASLPAAELLAIGAVGPNAAGDKWDVADFSNARAQLVAPGVGVVSAAVGGGWTTMSGTSMATPHAAGVAALWVEKARGNGSANVPGSVIAALRANATKSPLVQANPGDSGDGLVQAPQSQP